MKTTGLTIWFTGLSGSGKTTISRELEKALRARGVSKLETLDGDVVRTNLSKGLGFSKEDRDTNIRRIGFVAKLLTRNGTLVMCAAISPYRALRDEIRMDVGDFLEVYASCPVEVCEERDIKGLYKKARAGEIKGFTGVDDPYERPENPELVLDAGTKSAETLADEVIAYLRAQGKISPDFEPPASQK